MRLQKKGDILLLTDIFRCFKRKYPGATLVFATDKNNFDIVKNNPYLHYIINLNDEKDTEFLFNNNFDLLVDFENQEYTLPFVENIQAKYKLGWGRFPEFFNKFSKYTIKKDDYILDIYRELMSEYLYFVKGKYFFKIRATSEETNVANMFVDEHFPNISSWRIVMDIFNDDKSKEWPYYDILINNILEKYDAKILVVHQNEKKFDNFLRKIEKKDKIVNTNLPTRVLSEVILQTDLFIGNDSFPRHIALSHYIPAITPWGGVHNANLWTPKRLTCKNLCKNLTCSVNCEQDCTTFRCLKEIYPEEFYNFIDTILKE
jgi:ADP-heptose:LPS heptosyltransferase